MRIPSQTARTLTGETVTVPDDFTGERNAMLIAFERSHLTLFPAWKAALHEALAADPDLGYYAIALIGDVPGWHQRLASWALKLDINEDYAREHIGLIARDPIDWAAQLGLSNIDAPLLVICGSDGEVHATADGPPRAMTTQNMARALLA